MLWKQAEKIIKYSRVKTARDRSEIDHGQTELNNILVNKSVFNEINNKGTFTRDFKDWRKIKRKVSQNLDDFQNSLTKLTFKVSVGKAWLLYEFPFSLNPGDKPNDAQTWKNYSSLYPVSAEDQFQANSKKNWWNILEAAK